MSVNVRVLKAFHGDCIFITVDSGTVTERILIDGGQKLRLVSLHRENLDAYLTS